MRNFCKKIRFKRSHLGLFAFPNVAIRHFLDILYDVPKEDIDTEMLKGIFKDKAWGDLPYALTTK